MLDGTTLKPLLLLTHVKVPTRLLSRSTRTGRLSSRRRVKSFVRKELCMIFQHHTVIPWAPGRLSIPPESESPCGHGQYATFCFAYNTRHIIGLRNPYLLRHGRPTSARAIPFGALLDFRPPEPFLKKMPKMGPRGVPCLML